MKRALVIGGANYDIGARSAERLVPSDSNPGRISGSPGGVGRNIAHNMRLLGVDTSLLTVLGDDDFGRRITDVSESIGLDMSLSGIIPGCSTSSYLYILDSDGDMALAVNDMSITERMTPEFFSSRIDAINRFDLVVIDANLPRDSIEYLCRGITAPIIADPVSSIKASRLLPVMDRLYAIKPNRLEAGLYSGITIITEEDVHRAADILLGMGLSQVYISLSTEGIFAADAAGNTVRFACPAFVPVNATGGGDAMVAAIAMSVLEGSSLQETARAGIAAGVTACESESTINPAMSKENIMRHMPL